MDKHILGGGSWWLQTGGATTVQRGSVARQGKRLIRRLRDWLAGRFATAAGDTTTDALVVDWMPSLRCRSQ